MTDLIVEHVYSPINDVKNITKRTNIGTSPIWANAMKKEEYKAVLSKYGTMICYTIKFSGLEPVQVTKITKIK